jgi:hypothetical protein
MTPERVPIERASNTRTARSKRTRGRILTEPRPRYRNDSTGRRWRNWQHRRTNQIERSPEQQGIDTPADRAGLMVGHPTDGRRSIDPRLDRVSIREPDREQSPVAERKAIDLTANQRAEPMAHRTELDGKGQENNRASTPRQHAAAGLTPGCPRSGVHLAPEVSTANRPRASRGHYSTTEVRWGRPSRDESGPRKDQSPIW